ncbi:MAG: hypothetical protein WD378_10380 [Egicoccus sp.]
MRRLRPRVDTTLHFVDEQHRVGCNRVGRDVSVELCLACPALQSVERAGDEVRVIHCRPPAMSVGPDPWSGLIPRF